MSDRKATNGHTGPDWERIEADYRAGVLSLREVAARSGVTEGAVRKRAKKLGWTRDLTARIQAKADELVRTEAVRIGSTQLRTDSKASKSLISEADELACQEPVRTDDAHGTQQTSASALTDQAIVEANAHAIAAVRLAHRTDISRARRLCLALTEELEAITGERLTVERLRELMEAAGAETQGPKAIERIRVLLDKAVSLSSRAGTLKQLSDSLKTLVSLEREAWQIDSEKGAGNTYDDLLDQIHGEGARSL